MFHFAKYLGEQGKVTAGSFQPKADLLLILCPQCHQRHGYHPQDLRQQEVVGPPPAGLKDLL